MIEQVRPRELASWFTRNETTVPALVLDVREPAEWRAASVQAGEVTVLPMSMATVPARWQELDRQAPIACLCHHGARSMQVARFLVAQGFAHVANIAGGIDAWSLELDNNVPRY